MTGAAEVRRQTYSSNVTRRHAYASHLWSRKALHLRLQTSRGDIGQQNATKFHSQHSKVTHLSTQTFICIGPVRLVEIWLLLLCCKRKTWFVR